MAFDNYTDFQAAIANWLNRADLTAAIPDFIAQAEATLNKVLRTRYMIADTTINIATNADRVAVPTDFIDALYVVDNTNATHTLVKQVPEWMAKQQRLRLKTAGVPLYYTIIGANMLVCPVPASNVTYKLSYYQEIPALSNTNATNWVLQHHPDLYLYTALMHASPYMADDARSELFGQSIVKMVQSLISNNQTTTLEGQDYNEFKG
jgi:hypothetical protein